MQYLPYVYFIKFTNPCTKQKFYYIGSRYSRVKCANPKDFFVSYFTSSKYIKQLIIEFGIQNFEWSIRKTFDNEKSTLEYENKLLTKLNAKNRKDFINRSNGPNWNRFSRNGPLSKNAKNKQTKNQKKTFIEKYGVDNPQKSPEIKQKTKSTNLEKYGVETNLLLRDEIEKILLNRYGVSNPFQIPEIKKYISDLNKKKVNYNGQVFNSVQEVADFLGKPQPTISRWIRNNKHGLSFVK